MILLQLKMAMWTSHWAMDPSSPNNLHLWRPVKTTLSDEMPIIVLEVIRDQKRAMDTATTMAMAT